MNRLKWWIHVASARRCRKTHNHYDDSCRPVAQPLPSSPSLSGISIIARIFSQFDDWPIPFGTHLPLLPLSAHRRTCMYYSLLNPWLLVPAFPGANFVFRDVNSSCQLTAVFILDGRRVAIPNVPTGSTIGTLQGSGGTHSASPRYHLIELWCRRPLEPIAFRFYNFSTWRVPH